tara:strand:- start:862 stop:1380 length:519 start_codon:yes stop_codon:yes gene_type:complete
MKLKKEISFILIAIGIFIIIVQPFSSVLTGAVIEISSTTSRIWFFIGLGLIILGAVSLGWFDSGLEKHAAKRAKQRSSFPSVRDAAVKYGACYKLNPEYSPKGAESATHAYVLRNAADIAPGRGGIGERMIKVGGKRNWKNVIVLAKGKKVKTTFVNNDRELKAFLKKYTGK